MCRVSSYSSSDPGSTMQIIAILILALVSAVQAAPRRVAEDQYGNTYIYKYSTTSEYHDYPGANSIPSQVTECKVLVTDISATLRRIQVHECHMASRNSGDKDHTFTDQFNLDMSQHPVLFEQTERMENSIHSHPAEQPYALNLKRAIIELIVSPVSGPGAHEKSGVRGECNIVYTSSEDGLQINSELDLGSCSGLVLHSGPFIKKTLNTPSTAQAFFNVSGRESCQFKQCSERSVLCEAICSEEMTVQTETYPHPLGLVTRRKLEFLEISSVDVETGAHDKYLLKNLKYDKYPTATPKNGHDNVHQTFEELVESMQSGDPTHGPAKLSQLKNAMGRLNEESLQEFAEAVLRCDEQGSSCKDPVREGLFWDALFSCGTNNCLMVAVKRMDMEDSVGMPRASLPIALINSVSPNEESFRIVKALCKKDDSLSCLIPFSIISRKYTNEIPPEERSNHLEGILETFVEDLLSILKSTCATDEPRESSKIVHVMKALANLGGEHLSRFDNQRQGILVKTITGCISKMGKYQPDTATIGLHALSGYPLSTEMEMLITSLLTDIEYPVEFRTAVFKFLIGNGSRRVLEHMLQGANSLEVQQLRAYVTSHIQNIVDGLNPLNGRRRDIILDIIREKSIELPHASSRTQPRSQEWFTGNIVTSSDIKTNVTFESIYRPAGYLPTSNNFKVSVESLEKDIDMVEIDLYQYGFDSLIQTDNGVRNREMGSKIEQKLRELYHFFSAERTQKKATLHLKLLGFHIGQLAIDAGTGAMDVQSKIGFLLQMFVKGLDIRSSSATQLPLVSSIIVTSSGIPLNLTTDGSLLLSGSLTGTVDKNRQLWNTLSDIDNFDMSGRFKLRVVGEMASRAKLGIAGYFQSGIESTDQWLSDINAEFSLSSTRSQLELALDKLSPDTVITNARSTRLVDVDGQLMNIQDLEKSKCLWRGVERIFGWSLCQSRLKISPLVTYILNLTSLAQKQMEGIAKLAGNMLSYNGRRLTFRYNPTRTSRRTRRSESESWVAYVQDAWGRLERTIFHPPTTYTAMITGDSHITTFDGRSFTLPDYRTERCQYLLVRDTVEHQFRVIQSREKVEIISKTVSVTIDQNGRVFLDRSSTQSDLPVRSRAGDVVVLRQLNDIEVRTTFGFHLKYNINGKVFTVKVSERYHNKTIGLLGTTDNEPSNDFLTRTRDVTQNVNVFIQSHEISARQECHPDPSSAGVQRRASSCPDNGLSKLCNTIFGQEASSLSACFQEVDVREFLTICIREANECNKDYSEKQKAICDLTSAYRGYCQSRDIVLSLPATCKKCGQTNGQSQTWLDSTEAKVDVVVVTPLSSGHDQNTDYSYYIKALIKLISAGLKGSDKKYDLRVGLVGYGGMGAYSAPHIYTSNGKLFSTAQQMSQTQIPAAPLPRALNQNAVKALEMATDYPYRPKAVKLVFLISDMDPNMLPEGENLANKMLDAGVTLNIVSNYEELRSKKAVGLKAGGALIITSPVGQEITVDFPQSAYAGLSQSTGGLLLDDTAINDPQTLGPEIRNQVQQQLTSCNSCSCAVNDQAETIVRCRKATCSRE